MRNFWKIITALFMLAAAFTAGILSERRNIERLPAVVRTDTLTIRDTLTIERPVYRERRIVDSLLIAVTDTVRVRDTVYISVHREQRYYRDGDYEAWVSGYRPALDSIRVFPVTRTVTTERNVLRTSAKRWGIGIQAGYGATVSDGRIVGVPYVGIGLSYNILTF